ncbi:MAG: sodium:solute symporter [Eubacteriales bacterium]
MLIKIGFLVVFFATMVAVGIYSRKHASSVDGFVLGGRSAGPWLTAFAYGTSYFSAVVFVGYAGQFGWKYGVASTWIGIGNALIGSFLAWSVLGRRTRIMTQHLDAKTMPDFFEKRYGCKWLKIVASMIVFIFLIPYTASIYNGLSRLFGMAFDVSYTACVIGMAVFTGVYVILGGYMATAINDFIQGIIMLGGIIVVIVMVLNGQGGFYDAIASLAEIEADASTSILTSGAYVSFFGPDPINLLGVIILTSLGTWGLPQMIGKFYAIKDEKAIRSGTVISTFFAIIVSGGCYFLGGFGRLFDNAALYDESGAIVYDTIIPYMLSTLPDIIIGIVVVLVLSASMSTLSSLVLTSSSTLTLDLVKGNIIKEMKEKQTIVFMQAMIVVFITISVVIALNPTTFIAQLMGISWGALAGAFLAPFLYGLYWKKTTKLAVWASFVSGVGITVSNMIFGYIASPINAGAIAMIVGLVIVPVVSLITPKPAKEDMDEIFECLDEKVVITRRHSLED